MEIMSSTSSSDSITHMVQVALEENKDADPEKSPLARVGIKIPHPGTYSGSADLEELEIFVAGVLQWLKMNQYLGSTNTEFQVNYLGTHLEGEAWEWFLRNVEHFKWDVRDWTLETVVAGLQRRFLHTLTHHHASNQFKSIIGNKTIHEILNNLKKYTDRMVMQPDEYTFRRRFISALQEPLRQEVLKQGLNPEKSTSGQLYKLANAIEEATRYNQGTHRAEGIGTIPSMTQ